MNIMNINSTIKNIIRCHIKYFWNSNNVHDFNFKKYLIKGVSGTFTLKIVNVALLLISSVILARILDTNGYGTYAYIKSWIGLLTIPATLGLQELLMREVAIYKVKSEWELMRGLLHWANKVVVLSSIILGLITALIVWIFFKDSNPEMLFAFWIAIASLPILSLARIRLAAMKGLHKVILGQLPEMMVGPLLLIIFTIFSYFFIGNNLNVIWVTSLELVIAVITFIIGTYSLKKSLPKIIEKVKNKYQSFSWMTSAVPLIFLNFIQVINAKADILMLGSITGLSAVGIYSVTIRCAHMISFISIAVNSFLAPIVASLYAKGEFDRLQKIVSQASRAILIFSTITFLILIIFSNQFLLLFGKEFTQGKAALAILGFGYLGNAVAGPVGCLLNMTGHERDTAIGGAISAMLNVLLNFLLIPRFGMNGAAIATTVSLVFWVSLLAVCVYKRLGLHSTIILGKMN